MKKLIRKHQFGEKVGNIIKSAANILTDIKNGNQNYFLNMITGDDYNDFDGQYFYQDPDGNGKSRVIIDENGNMTEQHDNIVTGGIVPLPSYYPASKEIVGFHKVFGPRGGINHYRELPFVDAIMKWYKRVPQTKVTNVVQDLKKAVQQSRTTPYVIPSPEKIYKMFGLRGRPPKTIEFPSIKNNLIEIEAEPIHITHAKPSTVIERAGQTKRSIHKQETDAFFGEKGNGRGDGRRIAGEATGIAKRHKNHFINDVWPEYYKDYARNWDKLQLQLAKAKAAGKDGTIKNVIQKQKDLWNDWVSKFSYKHTGFYFGD